MTVATIALIAKLEDATGPSRELDAELALLDDLHGEAPHFTGSVDDALRFVPTVNAQSDRKSWALDLSPSSALYHAAVYHNHGWRHARGATPAIALCIACLRSRLHRLTVASHRSLPHSAD